MRISTLSKLRCPVDHGALMLNGGEPEADGHVIEGALICKACGLEYPIRKGVPEMLPPGGAQVAGEDLSGLQAATVERFGFEWQRYRDWGWMENLPEEPHAEHRFMGGLIANTRKAFWGKSKFERDELGPGVTVLDGGCGNGRFSHQAAETGAEVFGIDLGWGVHSAFEHMRGMENVHIVRGDLFRLPFAESTFDRAFSIGVLMHTGNAPKAFASIARTVKPTGLFGITVYGKGRWLYEVLDAGIRAITTRLSIGWQIRFSRLTARFSLWLRRGGKWRRRLHRRVFSMVNILPTEHHMFDWWSAPIATHHSPDEVRGWFTAQGLEVLRTSPLAGDEAAECERRYGHGQITVLGQRAGGSAAG